MSLFLALFLGGLCCDPVHYIDFENVTFQDFRLVKGGANYKLYFLEQQNVYLIKLKGTPYERGFAIGESLKSEIRQAGDSFLPWAKSFFIQRLKLDQFSIFKNLIAHTIVELAKVMIEFLYLANRWIYPNQLLQQLDGLMDGADYHSPNIIYLNMVGQLTKGSCTLAKVFGSRAAEGRPLFFRAFDWVKTDSTKYQLIRVDFDQDSSVISLGFPGFVGVLTGLNKAGLFIGEKYRHSNQQSQLSYFGQPFYWVMKRVIHQATNIDRGIEILKSANRTCSVFMSLGEGESGRYVLTNYTHSGVQVYDQTTQSYYNEAHPRDDIIFRLNREKQTCVADYLSQFKGPIGVNELFGPFSQAAKTGDVYEAVVDWQSDRLYFRARLSPRVMTFSLKQLFSEIQT